MATVEPTTLQEAIKYFADPANCREYLVARRWPDGVTCPRCGSKNVTFYEKYNRWHCREKHDAPQFTLKTGSIMEDSPLGLDKWMTAMWQIVNCRNGISSYEVHRAIGVTQKSAWFLDHRIRYALHHGSFDKMMSGAVEADETFIGGKAINMHAGKRAKTDVGVGGKGKVAVLGLLERGTDGKPSKVRTKVINDRKKKSLHAEIRKHVEAGSTVHTDALRSYNGLTEYEHQMVDHAIEYVRDGVHTNSLENFWTLVKRALKGTYVSVEPFHLFRYVDEQAFRYNNRLPMSDGDRFSYLLRKCIGKRLTYAELIGHEIQPAESF